MTYVASTLDAFVSSGVVNGLIVLDEIRRSENLAAGYLDPVVQTAIIRRQS